MAQRIVNLVVLLSVLLGARTSAIDCIDFGLQSRLFRPCRIDMGMDRCWHLDPVCRFGHGRTLL